MRSVSRPTSVSPGPSPEADAAVAGRDLPGDQEGLRRRSDVVALIEASTVATDQVVARMSRTRKWAGTAQTAPPGTEKQLRCENDVTEGAFEPSQQEGACRAHCRPAPKRRSETANLAVRKKSATSGWTSDGERHRHPRDQEGRAALLRPVQNPRSRVCHGTPGRSTPRARRRSA